MAKAHKFKLNVPAMQTTMHGKRYTVHKNGDLYINNRKVESIFPEDEKALAMNLGLAFDEGKGVMSKTPIPPKQDNK